MRRLLISTLTALSLVLMSVASPAQDLPALLADTIIVNPDQTLTASGAVEVLYKGSRLSAKRITYDQRTDRLQIEGPITLDDGQGSVLLASEADLSADFRDGLLKSARLVLQDQLHLDATSVERSDGRYTRLKRVRASSCTVCAAHPVPFWEIRASHVTHDASEQQIYFDDAQFRLAGIPIFYAPRLRMPDPSRERASGFLLPSVRSSTTLGFGVKQPYFFALGPSRDLTVTPYVTALGAHAAFLRYRQAFSTGDLELNGAFAQDRASGASRSRAYLFGKGSFDLGRSYDLDFQIEAVSDDTVLLDYGISEQDRLASGLVLSRTKRDLYFDTRLFHYRSLRTGDDNTVLPSVVGELSFARRFTPRLIGGQALLTLQARGLRRTSSLATDVNGDGVTDGRDVSRLSLGVEWRRQDILSNGMILGATAALHGDVFAVDQDTVFPTSISRLTPTAALELRWPWVRVRANSDAREVLEPIAQLVFSPDHVTPAPNEDSALVEFDEGNLFAFSRFPGSDVYEQGTRANIGLNYSRISPSGWTLRATSGRIIRAKDLGQFSIGTGLSGRLSDWLLAVQIQNGAGLSLTNRALFDDDFAFSRNELRVALVRANYAFDANYLWLVADPAEGRPNPTSELALTGGLQLSDGWRLNGMGRYDFNAKRATRAGAGLEFRNECALVNLSLSRRFTSSTTVQGDTEISLQVQLTGFGARTAEKSSVRSCGG